MVGVRHSVGQIYWGLTGHCKDIEILSEMRRHQKILSKEWQDLIFSYDYSVEGNLLGSRMDAKRQ